MKYQFLFLAVLFLNFSQAFGQDLIRFQDESTKKWGFKNKKGKVIISAEYDNVGLIWSEGVTKACRNEKCGYIDEMGKIIIPLEYDNGHAGSSEGLIEI